VSSANDAPFCPGIPCPPGDDDDDVVGPIGCGPGTSGDKPTIITLEYTGAACAVPLANDQSGKAKCSDLGALPPAPGMVQIRATGNGDVYADFTNISIGDQIILTAPGKFKSNTIVRIEDLGGDSKQLLMIHTSCSKTLALDDEFGSLKVVDMQ